MAKPRFIDQIKEEIRHRNYSYYAEKSYSQ